MDAPQFTQWSGSYETNYPIAIMRPTLNWSLVTTA
jgi:hypothetical protein